MYFSESFIFNFGGRCIETTGAKAGGSAALRIAKAFIFSFRRELY